MAYQRVPIHLIDLPDEPIRRSATKEGFDSLAKSIETHGLLQPPRLLKTPDDRYEVVVGSRRVRAARMAGKQYIDCVVVKEISQAEAVEQALIENLEREDMEPIDAALGLKRLMELRGWDTATDIGKAGFMPRKSADRLLKILDQPEDIQGMVGVDKGGRGEERRIAPLTLEHIAKTQVADDYQPDVLRKAAREGLTSREAQQVARTVRVALDHGQESRAKTLINTYNYNSNLFDPDREAERYNLAGDDQTVTQESPVELPEEMQPEMVRTDGDRLLGTIVSWGNGLETIRTAIDRTELSRKERMRIAKKLEEISMDVNELLYVVVDNSQID